MIEHCTADFFIYTGISNSPLMRLIDCHICILVVPKIFYSACINHGSPTRGNSFQGRISTYRGELAPQIGRPKLLKYWSFSIFSRSKSNHCLARMKSQCCNDTESRTVHDRDDLHCTLKSQIIRCFIAWRSTLFESDNLGKELWSSVWWKSAWGKKVGKHWCKH